MVKSIVKKIDKDITFYETELSKMNLHPNKSTSFFSHSPETVAGYITLNAEGKNKISELQEKKLRLLNSIGIQNDN